MTFKTANSSEIFILKADFYTYGPVQSHALNVGFMMKRDCSICAANTKGADQLGIYCTADLRLCFPIRKTSFPMYGMGSDNLVILVRQYFAMESSYTIFAICENNFRRPR